MWPGGFFQIAYAIDYAFGAAATQLRIFAKINDFSQYVDEYLALSAGERDSWQNEIEMLQDYLSGKACLPWSVMRRFQDYWESLLNEHPNSRTVYGTVDENLREALSLCSASVQTGNPIEFWL
jgi:hypothetical protein